MTEEEAALDRDCTVTFEQTRDALEEVERKIGAELDIRGTHGHIRRELLRLDREGTLVETRLVADWHDLFASYLDWTRNEEAGKLGANAPSEKPLPDAPGWWVRRIYSSRMAPASTSLVYIQIPIAPPYADAWFGPIVLPWDPSPVAGKGGATNHDE